MDGAMFTKLRRLGEINPARAAAVEFVLASLLAIGACSPKSPATAVIRREASASPPPPAVIRREIRVRIACDEEFRATPGWESVVRRWMENASRVFEARFAIRWKVIDVVPWTSDDMATSTERLAGQLENDVPRAGVDEVVGFVCQRRAKGADRDYELTGHGRFFGPVAVVRSLAPRDPEDSRLGVLVHELGHTLGMWHCSDSRFVMYEGDSTYPLEFDPQSSAVIDVTRDLDFSRGVEWLDDARRRRIEEIYRSGHAPDAELPHALAEAARGWHLVYKDGDVTAGRAEYRRALAVQARCVSAADRTLISFLTGLAWADLRDPEDIDEAESLARRAHAIVVATGCPADPPLDDELLLADVAWSRGRREESIVGCRSVYEARLRTLGPSNPNVTVVKDEIAWKEREAHPSTQSAAGK